MPFGLDGKTFVVTVLLMLFVYPWVMGKVRSMSGTRRAAAA